MWNIIFIGIDDLGDYFQEPDQVKALSDFKNNIIKLSEGENSFVVFVSRKYLDEVRYNAALLINYMNFALSKETNIVVGPVITKDYSADLYLKNNGEFEVTCDQSPVATKQNEIIDILKEDGIGKIIHITNGIDYEVDKKNEDLSNIIMYVDCNLAINPYEHDTIDGRDTTYLVSKESGLNGFNDCMNTYFENKDSLQLTR